MSQTIIEKLLKGAEVEWKPLGEIVKIADNARRPIKAELRKAGATPYYGANNIQDYVQGYTHEGDYVLVAEDGSKSLLNYSVQWACGCFWANNHVHVIQGNDKVISRFLFHVLKNMNFLPFLTGGTRAKLTKAELVNIPIPIPPLSVQKEIVRILDAFTAHTAELTAELNERKKQYNYYLNRLLTFSDDEVEWKKLGDITQTTKNIKWKNNNQHYLYIDLTSVDRENNVVARTVEISATNAPSRAQKIVEKDDVIFATTRPTLQRYTIIDDKYSGQIASSGYCVLRAKYKNVLPKWIYYNIASNMFLTYVEANQSGSAYPSISDAKVKEFILPIPSIKTQKRIASILDTFNALTTSISEGLPKEIELRNKQYEYYRDQLLNFPKPDLEN